MLYPLLGQPLRDEQAQGAKAAADGDAGVGVKWGQAFRATAAAAAAVRAGHAAAADDYLSYMACLSKQRRGMEMLAMISAGVDTFQAQNKEAGSLLCISSKACFLSDMRMDVLA